MWLMLQQDNPQDYVIATGKTYTVRHLLDVAFSHAGLDYRNYIEIDPALLRPAEVHHLRGDCSKAARELGWQPKTTFEDLIQAMVDEDLVRLGGTPAHLGGHRLAANAVTPALMDGGFTELRQTSRQ